MILEIMPCEFFVSTESSAEFIGIHVRSFFAKFFEESLSASNSV